MRKPATRLPPLELLAEFETAARHLSFTKAAAERFVTQSAMSRRIKALEDDLGVPLFRRRHRALVLTDEGQRLFDTCTTLLAELRTTVARIRQPNQRQVLALTTTPGLASLWLIPRLPAFTQAYPGIDVRIDASFRRRDLRGEGIDVAIRYAPAGSIEGTQLFAETVLPVCSPSLLKRSKHPLRVPEDLQHFPLLQMLLPADAGIPTDWDPWLKAMHLPDLQPATTLSFNNYGEVILAAIAGQGVALGRSPLIDDLLAKRQLVAPFASSLASPRAYYLVIDPAARNRPAVRALEQWLVEEARQPGTIAQSPRRGRGPGKTRGLPPP
jgi:LysR family transcriptional regulator, glycine cleavage system transcriptional activator